MKFQISFCLTIFFINSTISYVIQHVDGVYGTTETIEFDSIGNSYVISLNTNATHQLYKLNTEKEIQWTITDLDEVRKILINTKNDIYLQIEVNTTYTYLAIIKDDLTIENIDEIRTAPAFIDEGDNIFYNARNGINILRPNSTTPILIQNFEDYYFINERVFTIDGVGNVYLGVIGPSADNTSFAVVTKEAKQEKIPHAKLYDLDIGYYTDFLTTDKNNDLWVFTTDYVSSSQIKKLSNGVIEDILFDQRNTNHIAKAVGDRVYVVSITNIYNSAPTYFITLDGQLGEIPDFDNVNSNVFYTTKIVADKDEYTYFGSYYSYDKGEIALIKPNENNTTGIAFMNLVYILSMMLDEKENLWVGTDGQGIFCVKKGEIIPDIVSTPPGLNKDFTGYININKKTNDVFVLSTSGLYYTNGNSY